MASLAEYRDTTSMEIEIRRKITQLIEHDVTACPQDLSITNINIYGQTTKFLVLSFKKQNDANQEHVRNLNKYLWLLSHIETITMEFDKECFVAARLGAIMKVENNFPQEYQEIAILLHSRFESQGWGATRHTSTGEEGQHDTRTTTANKGTARKAHDDHPIFGLRGVCHHILFKSGSKNPYSIDSTYNKKDFKVFGHNGISVGQCWPLQLCALRDGAHGASQAGISGDANHGAWSVIVSGLYDELDRDKGYELFYSTADAHEAEHHEPNFSHSTTKSLMRSLEHSNAGRKVPVRVIRKHAGKWPGVPRSGFRYDGLYLVKGMVIKKNIKGGAYPQFKLVRMSGQDDIQMSKPTPREIQDFDLVSRGF